MRNTILEVDVNNFLNNIESIKKYVGSKTIAPVIKANAYGTYLNERIDLINMFDIVCVAIVDEAIHLRNIGYKKEIFILNPPSINEIDNIINYNLTFGLSSFELLEYLNSRNEKFNVHLEIETGMNRTGIKIDELDKYINSLKNNIVVEGIYTHLSSADYDVEYTNNQIEIFNKALKMVKKKYPNIKYIHHSASNGLLNYKDDNTNMVRPGIIMYGYKSFDECTSLIDIKPICKLKTNITFLKTINSNESVSYSRRFISNKSMKVATIPIGYADGLRRDLSNIGYIVCKKKKCRIIGSVCMDSCMIDVTDVDVKVGDEVYIWDNEIQSLEDIASLCNTINYEILCCISPRVKRVFVNEKIK